MKRALTFFFSFLIIANAWGQQRTIRGKVTDANGKPLQNVTLARFPATIRKDAVRDRQSCRGLRPIRIHLLRRPLSHAIGPEMACNPQPKTLPSPQC